jgi:hypothetical protein
MVSDPGTAPNESTSNFGKQVAGTASTITVTVTNSGYGTMDNLRDGGGLSNGFAWTGGTCCSWNSNQGICTGQSLAPGASCTMIVTFNSPGGQAGQTFNDTLTVQYDTAEYSGSTTGSFTLPVQGTNTALLVGTGWSASILSSGSHLLDRSFSAASQSGSVVLTTLAY